MRGMRRSCALCASVIAAAVVLLGVVSAASAAPAVPSADPFYTYSGKVPLKSYPRGAVLKVRHTTVSMGDNLGPFFAATQVLYRTTNELGQPSATVATIIAPTLSTGKMKLLSYQTAYDGLSDTCRPSYQLQGGIPNGTGTTIGIEHGFMLAYLEQGYTLVTADYEGPTDDYNSGQEVGDDTLDAILAAENQMGLAPKSTPIGMVGYSGGSEATMWAAERQPSYAPELDLIGIAAGGIPVDYAHNIEYINGSATWGGAIPALYLGLMRGFHVNPDYYLNAYGQNLVSEYAQGCLGSTNAKAATFDSILKPQFQDWQKVPSLDRILNDEIMGQESTPTAPMFLVEGDADGIGDGVMVEKDVQQLAYEYCQRGDSVKYDVFDGANHDVASALFEPLALVFLDERYAGVSTADGCSKIGPGDPLTPLSIG